MNVEMQSWHISSVARDTVRRNNRRLIVICLRGPVSRQYRNLRLRIANPEYRLANSPADDGAASASAGSAASRHVYSRALKLRVAANAASARSGIARRSIGVHHSNGKRDFTA
jgi:hypothetical protein